MTKLHILLITIVCASNFAIGNQNFNPSAFQAKRGDLKNIEDRDERIPVYVPGKCPENQILYPGPTPADWVCDCRPGFVYWSLEKTCYAVYSQGPCMRGFHLTLNGNAVRCTRNKCKREELVKYGKQCWEIGKPGGPCHNIENGVLEIEPVTLRLGCLKNRQLHSLVVFSSMPTTTCFRGSYRALNGQCNLQMQFV